MGKGYSKQKKNRFAKRLGIVILIIFMIFFIGCVTLITSTILPNTDMISQPETIYEISARSLHAEYETNEIAADQLYKDKTLRVKGILVDIGKDILDSPYVTLKTDGFWNIQCMLSRTEINKAANLRPGQQITVQGRNEGKLLSIILRKCIIL